MHRFMNVTYLLDSNVFIEAHQGRYPMDVFPSYWRMLSSQCRCERMHSLSIVKRELMVGADDLSDWISSAVPPSVFLDESEVVRLYAEVVAYVANHSQYTQAAKDVFLSAEVADAWLIAYAKEYECTIVTNETSSPESKTRIKIPDVCMHYNVRCIKPIEMLRELGITI